MSTPGYHSGDYNYVVITPVRDEANYIQKTIDSLAHQLIKPLKWVIVDDGSSDDTPIIVKRAAEMYPWIKAIHIPDRGYRKPGGGVVEAFYAGYKEIKYLEWDFIVKLDGDLSFKPDYFQKCIEYINSNSQLGIGGGTVCYYTNGKLEVDSKGDPPFHVRGATKIYRQRCWNQIHPLEKAPGWDTIDEVKANRLGWRTQTFAGLNVIQHKATGSAEGKWQNWFKNGRANYITGYHPLFMLGKCVKRIFQKPILLASAALWTGFCSGYISGIEHINDVETIRYLRLQQLRRLMLKQSIYG